VKKGPSQYFEQQALAQGYKHIAGVDEVGRGSLAGPVIAAAVILPSDHGISGLDDSKRLTPKKREVLYTQIYKVALAIGIGSVEPQVIDEINILQASLVAMKKAIEGLKPQPHFLLVDGNLKQITYIPQKSIVGGDGLSESIAAASIVAKVFRDNLMKNYNDQFPQYRLDANKGYPTPDHLEALKIYGISKIHRRTFHGVMD